MEYICAAVECLSETLSSRHSPRYRRVAAGKSLFFSFFSPSHPREEIPAMVRRTASKNAFKNSGETPIGVKGERREDREGCIRNATYNHRVEMHRDDGSTSGFNRIASRIGPAATPCRCSLRHSDRMQERASSPCCDHRS